ncbi:MAG: UDP-N-acetylmuramoyl-tripeptide--D-alanyl-D-alanine ligase [Candidatus Paceibacterota bacterium]|jgi:UDP-N-acetylmuramoyl-tripeptide--D-alanyl-D-alanine ligase
MSIPEIHKLFLKTTGISTDTRNIIPGSLFISLKGEHFDGNKFALEALDKGATFALVSDLELQKNKNYSDKIIVVEDTLKTLQDLANFHRKQFTMTVIAITGTNGKTTTKNLIAEVLEYKYKVIKTEGNLNNHIGVPLTLLRITKNTEIAIIEMGANTMSDIADLCKIAEPTHGIITNIGTAHLQGFGTKAGVAQAKSELYIWLRDHAGVVFINKHDKDLTSLVYSVDSLNFLNNVLYGDETVPENKYLIGDFNKENMKTAVAVGLYFKIKKSDITKALKNYEPKNMRSEWVSTKKENDIILDAYNANPSSMKAVLHAFTDLKSNKTKWLILGDMKELGEESQKEHTNILWEILKLNLSNVILIGEEFYQAHEKTKRYASFKTKEGCIASHLLQSIKRSNILIKGSNSMKMWELVPML